VQVKNIPCFTKVTFVRMPAMPATTHKQIRSAAYEKLDAAQTMMDQIEMDLALARSVVLRGLRRRLRTVRVLLLEARGQLQLTVKE
jgi:hypothetical protein